MNFPYRERPQTQILVHGEAAPSVYMWVGWLASVAVVGIILSALDVGHKRAVIAGALALTVSLLLALHLRARRSRWRFVLEASVLRIQRLQLGSPQLVAELDVGNGVRFTYDMVPTPERIEMLVNLTTDSAHVVWNPGQRVASVVVPLVGFLREHDVDVSEPSPVPLGPFSSATFIGGA